MVIPKSVRVIGRTVRLRYVVVSAGFVSMIMTVGFTPAVFAAPVTGSTNTSSAPLGKTLGGLVNNTVPAVTKTLTDVTAPITNDVSPALTRTLGDVTGAVSNTVAPTAINTVDKVTTPVVSTVADVTGPTVPAVIKTVDIVAAPVTNTVVPATVDTVDGVVTPVTTTVGAVAAPIAAPVRAVVNPVVQTVEPVVGSITASLATSITTPSPSRLLFTSDSNTDMSSAAASLIAPLSLSPNSLQFPTPPATSTAITFAGIFGGIASFISGVLPPFAWILEGVDTGRAIMLWMILLVVLLVGLVIATSGSMYRKLRLIQHEIYSVSDSIALEAVLSPKTARIIALATTGILIGVIVINVILTGI